MYYKLVYFGLVSPKAEAQSLVSVYYKHDLSISFYCTSKPASFPAFTTSTNTEIFQFISLGEINTGINNKLSRIEEMVSWINNSDPRNKEVNGAILTIECKTYVAHDTASTLLNVTCKSLRYSLD